MFGRKKEDTTTKPKKETKDVEVKAQTKPTKTKVESKPQPKKTQSPKPTAKKVKEEKKSGLYRVVFDKDSQMWQIKLDGAKRVIDSKHTKVEALERVKELSQNKDVGFVVHKKDGKFQKK